jgi:hypothetical protein
VVRWRLVRIIVVGLVVVFDLAEKGYDGDRVCCWSPFRCTL